MPSRPPPFICLRPSCGPLSNLPIRRPLYNLPGSRRYGPRYSRFNNTQKLRTLWSTDPYSRYGLGFFVGCCVIFYVANLERVPISGRLQFNCIPTKWEQHIGGILHQKMLKQYNGRMVPPDHPDSQMVERVMEKLIPASGLEGHKWETVVIKDDEQKNAFVLTGGKVFVFSGILPICAGDDGLAAVLGHEIAHNVAHHVGERLSQALILLPLRVLLYLVVDVSSDLIGMVMDLAYSRPGSRKQETEADLIGLLIMAKGCYDPQAAIAFWHRMEAANKHSPPQFLSTHPSHHNRTKKMEEWLPQAQLAYSSSECGDMIRYGIIMPLPAASPKTQKRANGSQTANEFKSAFETQVQDVW